MNTLLYELYSGRYSVNHSRGEVPREAAARMEQLQEQIQRTLGLKFLDELNDLEADWTYAECFRAYREGVLLGARLMLEVLTPA